MTLKPGSEQTNKFIIGSSTVEYSDIILIHFLEIHDRLLVCPQTHTHNVGMQTHSDTHAWLHTCFFVCLFFSLCMLSNTHICRNANTHRPTYWQHTFFSLCMLTNTHTYIGMQTHNDPHTWLHTFLISYLHQTQEKVRSRYLQN